MHKITGNEASTISSLSHSHIRVTLCCSVDKSRIQFVSNSVVYMFLTIAKMYVNFIILAQSKYTNIHQQENPSIGCNALQFFCVPLYTEFLSDLYKKFQVASTYYTIVEYQI